MENISMDARIDLNTNAGDAAYFSVLLAWDMNDVSEQGCYGWSGFAESGEDAIQRARTAMHMSGLEPGDTFDPDDVEDYYVIELYEGANLWAAREMYDALVAAHALIKQNVSHPGDTTPGAPGHTLQLVESAVREGRRDGDVSG